MKKRKGFTLVEMLIVLFMFSLITVSFYRVFSAATVLMIDAKKRVAAANVANERMEYIRSLIYTDVGLVGSSTIPGVVSPDEYITSGSYTFHVVTNMVYVDDAWDGLEGTGDYKRATVIVSWGDEGENQKVRMHSDFVPFGTEDIEPGKGAISIRVIDSEGSTVSGASINVYNAEESINDNFETTSSGYIMIPNYPVSYQKYRITVSKSGYETVITQPPYPTSDYYPTDVNASVFEMNITESIINSSPLSNIKISFLDPYGEPLAGNFNFYMKGGRIIGTETDGTIKYNYDELLVSDSDGTKDITGLSPGNYEITLDESGYKLWRINSVTGNEPDEIIIPQGDLSYQEGIKILNETVPSYFVQILDGDTGYPLHGAEVTLSNSVLAYSEKASTDEYGYAYFPDDSSLSLTEGENYDVEVVFAGYDSESKNITISGLTQDNINLDPQ
ncbi:MAG: carboxypeptidase regulatory-like domain-containing protein [Candidatus Moranbacteria bacterium]|nr:carboxypeptidase regulatory-like domain-containing protein [Candidatus Moranbacteria bacterium]MDX9855371.1 carboxypeptidase regulatory-like domain-containing protein [Candidatus Moranbacteria bacterium]